MTGLPAPFLQALSRREFLKLSGSALLGLAIFPVFSSSRPAALAAANVPKLGRVTAAKIDGYAQPSSSGDLKKTYWRDLVLDINEATVGNDAAGYNRVWYRVNQESYVYSGNVQPVDLATNPAVLAIPENGRLAQVTVPFTDALWNPEKPQSHAYRLYYGCTFWVLAAVQDDQGVCWYRLKDDKWPIFYYAKAAHLHLVSADEIAPLSPGLPAEARRIEVHLPEQVVIAYESDRPVFMARAATGAKFADGDHTTPKGIYVTAHKRHSRHMAAGDHAAADSYDLPGVPWVSYIMENGISFHGTYWHNDFGAPRSHGCINLSIDDALWIYRWSLPSVLLQEEFELEKSGTIVSVIDKPMG